MPLMEEKLFTELKHFAQNHIYKWYGFVAFSFLIQFAFLIFYNEIPVGKVRFLHFGYFSIVVEFVLFAWWLFFTFYIRKSIKNKIGVIVCIFTDTLEAEQSLKRDFISELEKQLTSSDELQGVFDILVIKNHLAKKYNTVSKIKQLHLKTKGHIYIFGEIKKRRNGDEQYFMNLNGLVLHKPIQKNVSNEISRDFSATLPKTINFSEIFAFKGFSVSANIVTRSVQFIVGIASFVSGNPLLAIKLHTNLKEKLNSSEIKLPCDSAIGSKLNSLLADEHAIVAAYYLEKGNQENANLYLEQSTQFNPLSYNALIVKSLVAFSWEDNPKKALEVLKKCNNSHDPVWRYNEAFLRFWLNQYPSAWKQCEKIRRQNSVNDELVSKQVTDFNENLFKVGKGKPVLYFWLAFNYYFKQDNLPLALKNLEDFLNNTSDDDKDFQLLRQKAKGWLIEVKKKGGW
jgi:hypothetical protein